MNSYHELRTRRELEEWAGNRHPYGLMKASPVLADGPPIDIGAGKVLRRDNPNHRFKLLGRHNVLKLDCTVDKANVGTSLLFDGATPCYGHLPTDDEDAGTTPEGIGGHPWRDGLLIADRLASVHGRFGGAERCASWWADGRSDEGLWLQAAIDSGPVLGARLNTAIVHLGDLGRKIILARPLNFDLRFTRLVGAGRDTSPLQWGGELADDWPAAMVILSAYHPDLGDATTGFDTQLEALQIYGRNEEDLSVFGAWGRVEEMSWVRECHVFNSASTTFEIGGANAFTVGQIEVTSRANGYRFLETPRHEVGQGPITMRDVWVNSDGGTAFDVEANARVSVNNAKIEGVDCLLYQGGDNTGVSMRDVMMVKQRGDKKTPLVRLGGPLESNAYTDLANIHKTFHKRQPILDRAATNGDDYAELKAGQGKARRGIVRYTRTVSQDWGRRSWTHREDRIDRSARVIAGRHKLSYGIQWA